MVGKSDGMCYNRTEQEELRMDNTLERVYGELGRYKPVS